jgi:tetratricopeptide (TPR) repeat protein
MKPFVRPGLVEWQVRLPSLLLGVAVIPVAFSAVSRVWGKAAARVVAALLAVSWFQVSFSQQARDYSAMALFALLGLLLTAEGFRRPRWWVWAAAGLCHALAFYAHYFSLFGIAALFAWGLGLVSAGWIGHWPAARSRALGFGASVLVFLGLSAPGWSAFLQFVSGQQLESGATVTASGQIPLRAFLLSLSRDLAFGPGWLSWIVLALFLAGGAFLIARRHWNALALTVLYIVPPLAFVRIVSSAHFFTSRYVIFIQPAYLATAAVGAIGLAGLLRRMPRPLWPRPTLARVLTVLVSVGLLIGATVPLVRYYFRELEGWRDVATYLDSAVTGKSRLIVEDPVASQYLGLLKPRLEPLITSSTDNSLLEPFYAGSEQLFVVLPDWSFLSRRSDRQERVYWGIYDGRALNLDFSHVYVKRAVPGITGSALTTDSARSLQRAVDAGGTGYAAQIALGKLWQANGQPGKASGIYRTALILRPSAWVCTLLGDAQLQLKRPDNALIAYWAALMVNPTYANRAYVQVALAKVNYALGDIRAAKNNARSANRLSPGGGALTLQLDPVSGVRSGGVITATGGGFAEESVVEWTEVGSSEKWVRLPEVQYVRSNLLTFRVPADAADARYAVHVVNPNGLQTPPISVTVGAFGAPRAVEVIPSEVSARPGDTVAMEAVFEDADGWKDINVVYLTIGAGPRASAADIELAYNLRNDRFNMRVDGQWKGGLVPGAAAEVAGSHAVLLGAQSTVSGSGERLTVRFTFRLAGQATTTGGVYLLAADTSSQVSGWTEVGKFVSLD